MKSPREIITLVGCGDIGQRVAQQLDKSRYQVFGIRRHPPKDNTGINYVAADSTDLQSLHAAMPEHSNVIVITMTPGERSDEGYRKAYVESVKNLLQVLENQTPPRLLMFVSSTSVYGQSAGEWIDEQSPTEPTSFSGKRLLEAEALLQQSKYPSVIVRFSGIYGPGRGRLIDQVKKGQFNQADTTQFTNRIHSEDCAGIIAHLINYQAKGLPLSPCYIGSDNLPVTAATVKSWLAGHLGVKHNLPYVITTPSDYRNKRCRNALLIDSGYRFRYPDYQAGYGNLIRAAAETEQGQPDD